MAGWFTTSTINTGVFYSSEENHELDQDKLEKKKERQNRSFYLNELSRNLDQVGDLPWRLFFRQKFLSFHHAH